MTTKRVSLPGADELFRRTADRQPEQEAPSDQAESPREPVARATNLQVAEVPRGPKHDEKVTFYCTGSELTRLERVRLSLRADHGLPSDRGRIVRAALQEVLEDFEARGESSALVRRLQQQD
jgi:hypothetical protein